MAAVGVTAVGTLLALISRVHVVLEKMPSRGCAVIVSQRLTGMLLDS